MNQQNIHGIIKDGPELNWFKNFVAKLV